MYYCYFSNITKFKKKKNCVAGFYICFATQSGSKSSYVISLSQSVFILRILLCIQNDDHPENNLVKFWLQTRYESRKKTESSYILGYLRELIIKIWRFGFVFVQNLVSLGQFFHEKFFA